MDRIYDLSPCAQVLEAGTRLHDYTSDEESGKLSYRSLRFGILSIFPLQYGKFSLSAIYLYFSLLALSQQHGSVYVFVGGLVLNSLS